MIGLLGLDDYGILAYFFALLRDLHGVPLVLAALAMVGYVGRLPLPPPEP